jgi:hypothetical protein
VQVRRRIRKRIRRSGEGLNLAADINADVSVNTAETGPRRVAPPPSRGATEANEKGKENQ